MNLTILKSQLNKLKEKAVYIQIADKIIEYIKNGILKVGETMPSSRQMASELGINRNTVVQALDILVNEGWLISEERKRIFVSDKIQIYQTPEKKNIQLKTREFFRNDLEPV